MIISKTRNAKGEREGARNRKRKRQNFSTEVPRENYREKGL